MTSVLHLSTGREWRGGEAQLYHLMIRQSPAVVPHLLAPSTSALTGRLRESGIPDDRLHRHPMRGEWDLSATWCLRREHRHRGFGLLHAHDSHAHGIAALASALFDLPPLVVTRRMTLPVARNPASRLKYAAAARYVAISPSSARSLQEAGVPPERISVVPSGVDVSAAASASPDFELLDALGLDPDRPLVGNVGALSPEKDHETFVRVAAIVRRSHPEAQFVIAGEGELRGELECAIGELDLEGTCVLAGFVEDVPALLKTLDVFALTSVHEGLCSTLLQVMACGIPIVATRIAGVTDLIDDGATGRLVPRGSPHQAAEEVLNFLNDPDPFHERSRRAREVVWEYDLDVVVPRVAAVYREVLESIGT